MFSPSEPAPWEAIPAKDRPLNPNSALLWLPPIVAAGLPVPRTEVVKFDPAALWAAIGEADPARACEPLDWPAITDAAQRVGLPCFVRTDLSSAKHGGPLRYRLNDAHGIPHVVCATFEDNALKDLAAGPTPCRALLFREWLDLDAPFAAFGYGGEGHPIAREWRLFARPDCVECAHFYWPEAAIDGHDPTVLEWRALRAEMAQDRTALPHLEEMAQAAVSAVSQAVEHTQAWSVDFARDRTGKWWLIDMALARASWHPAHG